MTERNEFEREIDAALNNIAKLLGYDVSGIQPGPKARYIEFNLARELPNLPKPTEEIELMLEPDTSGKIPDPFSEQVGGNHYATQPVQTSVFCELNGLSPLESQIVGYITRRKERRKDLHKAAHMLQMLIALEFPDDVAWRHQDIEAAAKARVRA